MQDQSCSSEFLPQEEAELLHHQVLVRVRSFGFQQPRAHSPMVAKKQTLSGETGEKFADRISLTFESSGQIFHILRSIFFLSLFLIIHLNLSLDVEVCQNINGILNLLLMLMISLVNN